MSIRVVVDTNVILAGIVGRPEGPPALLLDALARGRFEAVACPRLVRELRDGLAKPFFRARLTAEEAGHVIAAIESAVVMVADPTSVPRIVKDPRDDFLVALAKEAGAEAIVSGDRDLLDDAKLEPAVIDARAACARLALEP